MNLSILQVFSFTLHACVCISRHGIKLELETKRLTILNVEHFPIMRDWYIVRRKNKRLSTASHSFKEFLLTEATT